MDKQNYDVAIIGGGPAGMMAGIFAAQNGAKVVLIEKNHKLGTKLLLTGGGRCNITNNKINTKNLKEIYGKEADFLMKSFSNFGVKETLEFFEKRGLGFKTEKNDRVFPVTDKAQDVLSVLLNCLKENKVEILYNCEVLDFELNKNKIKSAVLQNKHKIFAKNFIICTGGKSFAHTGSSGDGYNWAEKMGHKVNKPRPALVPIKIKESWVKDLQGLTLNNANLVLMCGKKTFKENGEIIFTHFGLSGPLALAISKDIGKCLETGEVKIKLDLNPDLSFEELDRKLQKHFLENPNKLFKNCLQDFVSEALALVLLKMLGTSAVKKANDVKREERKSLVKVLKNLEMTVEGLLDFNVAMVTSGGVCVKEIEAKTMKSKIIGNLFLAGEILDFCAQTGGFNLQLCWSTGALAGENSIKLL